MATGFPTKANWVSGDILTAAQMDDLAGTVNALSNAAATSGSVLVSNVAGTSFAYQPLQAAGKNAVINGGMDIWQRGTSFPAVASTIYSADRWAFYRADLSLGATLSQQTSAPTTFKYCSRIQRDSGNTGTALISYFQAMESVNLIPLAGQTVTVSWYARAGANFSAASSIMTANLATSTGTDQSPNSARAGVWTGQTNALAVNQVITTTWTKYSASVTLGSTVTQLGLNFGFTPVGTAGANDYFEITGVQLELGSVATTFSRAGGTIQGELAACQRYYWRQSANSTNLYADFAFGTAVATTSVEYDLKCPVSMRITPTVLDYSLLSAHDGVTRVSITTASITALYSGVDNVRISSASTPLTQYRPYFIQGTNSASAYIGLSAEL